MNNAEYRENALIRAIEENLQDRITIRSMSGTFDYDGKYTLTVDDAGAYWCDCPSFEYRGYCKHVAALVLKLTRDGEAIERTPGFTVVHNGRVTGG